MDDDYPEIPYWRDPHEMTAQDWPAWYRDWVDSQEAQVVASFDCTISDEVNQPKHYKTFPDLDSIDIIQHVLTHKEYIGMLKGNYLKYKLRAGKKDSAEKDLAKAKWYQDELFAYIEAYDE